MRFVWLGLAALLIGLGMTQLYRQDRRMGLQRIPRKLECTQSQMNEIAKYLRDYKKKTGNYPSNDEGLLAIPELVKACRVFHSYRHSFFSSRATDSGILTIWGEPFIYENRKGLRPSLFNESGANDDKKRRYSVRVDEDVYIWSVVARDKYNDYQYWTPIFSATKRAFALVFLGVFVLFVIDCRRVVMRCSEKWRGDLFTANIIGGALLSFYGALA